LQSLTLRGENFRWADLVSGNLKEVEATSLSTLALWNAIVKLPNLRKTAGPSTETADFTTVGALAVSAAHHSKDGSHLPEVNSRSNSGL
jgi:hypothetical protein